MAQQDIINLLIKKKRPISIVDLSKELHINKTNVARACRKLVKSREIKVIKQRDKSCIRHLISL